MLLQQTILMIDTILVGGLGEESVAAMGIATSIAGLLMGVLFALSNGTQIVVAQAYGANQDTALKSGFWSGLIVGSCVATIGIVCILLFRDNIIAQLTSDAAIATMAGDYLLISTIFIAGIAASQNISVFLYATDKPKIPFYSNVMELPVNALLSYSLIYGAWGLPELGVIGAAIGSVVAVILRCIFLFWYLYAKNFDYLLTPGWTKNSVHRAVASHLSNALPIAGTFISMNLAFTVNMMIYSQLEVVEFAAFTILFIWVRFSGLLSTSWCQGLGIWVGRLLGQDRSGLLGPFVFQGWKMCLFISAFIMLVYGLTPFLFNLLYPNLDKQTLDVFQVVLPALLALPLLRGSNTVCGNVLRAAGQAGYAFKVHVTAQWLFTVPMTALLVLVLDVSVLWVFSLVFFEEVLKAIPFHTRILSGTWKKRMEF